MKAVAVMDVGRIEVVDIPMPTIRDYECLVKVHACGLCNSTDLKIMHNELSGITVNFPVILGHEGVGEVVEVGSKVKNIKCGDRFTNPHGRVEPGTPYGRNWAGMVEYAIVQDHEVMDELGIERDAYTGLACRRIPASISSEDAAVLLTLKEGYSSLRNFGFRPGMDALVYGDGPAGLALVRFLRMGGAGRIACVGHWRHRLEHVRNVGGADLIVNSKEEDVDEKLGAWSFDLAIDAVGSTAIIKQASQLLKPRGKVGVYGVLKRKASELSLLDLRNNTAVHMLNWPWGEHAAHDEIVEMVVSGKLNPKDFYSHVVPLEDVQEAVRKVVSREALKVILKT